MRQYTVTEFRPWMTASPMWGLIERCLKLKKPCIISEDSYGEIVRVETPEEHHARTGWHENKNTAIYNCPDWRWLVVKKINGQTMWRGYRKATPEIVRYFERFGYSLSAARAEKHFIIEL